MKILHMRLLAFGPFTDILLDLSEGQEGLHIIYGPNEAGKSSALRAVRQLLYGIPPRSPDNFIHPHGRMRIGCILRRDDGTILEFIRRKGRVNTLRATDDATVIDEPHLRTFLGGVDEALFATMFGIDHADLVQGGEEIIRGEGDVGQILFAAGSGISHLRRVQDDLRAEGDALFLSSGQKPPINEATNALKKKQKAIREAQLPGQEWIRHDATLREAVESKRKIERSLEERQRERHRLERIKEALPAISHQKERLKALEQCTDAVILSDDFGDRRRDLLTRLQIAENDERQALENLKMLIKETEKLDVPEKLIQHAEAIEDVYKDLGSHRKASKDRSQLLVRKGVLEGDAQTILLGFRGDVSLDQADQLRLSKAETVRIQELGNQYERLITQLESAQEEMGRLSSRLEQLKSKLAGLDKPKDTRDLHKVIERVRQQGALEEKYATECAGIQRAEQAVEIALKKQDLFTGTLEELEILPLPSLETIDTFDHRLGEAENVVEIQRTELEALQCSIIEIEGQIEQLRLEQEVPTEGELHEGRQKRDEGWQLVHRAWKEKYAPGQREGAFVAAFPPAKELAEAYELSVQKADEFSDRLRREADRVAKKATLLAQMKTHEAQSMRLKGRLEAAESELTKIREEWSAVWGGIGILPKSPREMRVWTQNQALLADQVSSIRERKAKADELKARIEACCRELSSCLTALGEPREGEDETLVHLLDRGRKRADQIDKARMERDHLLHDQARLFGDLRELESRAGKTERDLAQWRSRWEEAIRPLGLKEEATPAQANAVVEDLKTLFIKLGEADILRKRIKGIDQDAEEFTERFSRLAGSVAPDFLDLSVDLAADKLNTRLTHARTAKTRQQSIEKQEQQEQNRLRTAKSKIDEIHAQLAAMCEEAGCKGYEDLQEAEERSNLRRNIQSQLEQLEGQLLKLSAGLTIDEFVRDALTVDSDGIDPAIGRLTEEIDRLETQKSEFDKTIGREENELSKMDGSAQAAELAEEAQGLLARLETDVEQYVRLRLATTVLSQAIERYREKNQGPILKRSNELFAGMSLGSFEGLRVEVNEKSEAALVGVRPGGKETVDVRGMSDGTTDQLYLAIRLASLEAYLEKNETMPLIVDDILIRFDDKRAIATLKVLAQLAKQTQIIFFTHHRHLVELAEANVNKEVLFAHSL